MIFAFYNKRFFNSAEKARSEGALYESPNNITYEDFTNKQDIFDIIYTVVETLDSSARLGICTVDKDGKIKEIK